MRKKIIIFVSVVAVLSFLPLSFIFAQEATPVQTSSSNFQAIDCREANEKGSIRDQTKLNGQEKQINQFTHNFIINAFSRGTLYHRLRCDSLLVGTDSNNDGQPDGPSVYKVSLNLVNLAVLLILIVIAFANILRIKLDTYAVKKAVPLLIFGVVMANLALPIIRTIVDFSGVLTATFIGETSNAGTRTGFVEELIGTVYHGGVQAIGNTLAGLDGGFAGWVSFLGLAGIVYTAAAATGPLLFALMLGALFLIVLPSIIFAALGLLFVVRLYLLVMLAAVAPVAFASLGFEPLKGALWGWWWKHFLRWTFMAPATFFLFWLAVQFFHSVGSQMDIGTYILTLVILSFALKLPLTMGGTVFNQVNDKFIKPLREFAFKPFQAGGEFARKSASLAFSQRKALFGGRILLPATNVAKAYREFRAKREEQFAKDEKGSPAARFGRTLGEVINRTGLSPTKAWRGFQEAKIAGVSDAANANTTAFTKRHGGSDSWQESKSKDDLVKQIDEAVEREIASGDADRIVGAYLAMAKIGRNLTDEQQKKFLEALRKMGLNTSIYETIYQRTFRIKQGFSVATPEHGKSDEAVRNEFIVKINSDIASKQGEPKAEAIRSLADKFKSLRDENNVVLDLAKGADRPKLVNLIKNDSTLFGYANALLNQTAYDPAARDVIQQKNQGLYNFLQANEGLFKAVTVEQHFTKSFARMQREGTQLPINDPRFLQSTVQPSFIHGVSAENWASQPEPAKRFIQEFYIQDGGTSTKTDLKAMLVGQMEQASQHLGIDYGSVENSLERYATDITKAEAPNAAPKLATAEGIATILADAGVDKADEVAPQFLEHLRGYQSYAESFQHVHALATQLGQIPQASGDGPTVASDASAAVRTEAARGGANAEREQTRDGAEQPITAEGRTEQARQAQSDERGRT